MTCYRIFAGETHWNPPLYWWNNHVLSSTALISIRFDAWSSICSWFKWVHPSDFSGNHYHFIYFNRFSVFSSHVPPAILSPAPRNLLQLLQHRGPGTHSIFVELPRVGAHDEGCHVRFQHRSGPEAKPCNWNRLIGGTRWCPPVISWSPPTNYRYVSKTLVIGAINQLSQLWGTTLYPL